MDKQQCARARQEKAKELVQRRSRGRGLPVEGGCLPPSVFPEPLHCPAGNKAPETENKVEDESRRKALPCVVILLTNQIPLRSKSAN